MKMKILAVPAFAVLLSSCSMVREVQASTNAIQCNRAAVEQSTEAIQRNIEAVERSNRVIDENIKKLSEINSALEKA